MALRHRFALRQAANRKADHDALFDPQQYVPWLRKAWARSQAAIVLHPIRKIKAMIRMRAKNLVDFAFVDQAKGNASAEETNARIDQVASDARRMTVLMEKQGSPIKPSRHPGPRIPLLSRVTLVRAYTALRNSLNLA